MSNKRIKVSIVNNIINTVISDIISTKYKLLSIGEINNPITLLNEQQKIIDKR